MTSNLIGGWLQGLDPLRKYGFGSLGIFGDENKEGETFEIHAVWIFRGQEVPFEMKDNIDRYVIRKMFKKVYQYKKIFNFYLFVANITTLSNWITMRRKRSLRTYWRGTANSRD